MKSKKTIVICMFAVAFGLFLNACKKDSSSTTSTTANEAAGVSVSTSATASEMMYDDAFDIVNQSSEQNSLTVSSIGNTPTLDAINTNATGSYTTTAGATITVVPANSSVFPKTITVDFGTGVTSATGITRKGQIIITLTGKIRVAGTVITATYNNYTVNGYKITGTYSLTPHIVANAGVNYNVTVSNGSITFPSGDVATYSGTETFTQTAGIGTASITDDTYEITGNFSYSNTNGASISGTITTPLVKSADCKDITSGIIAFTYKSINGTLDFGAGTCDNLATVKFGLTTKTITLPR
ncbi:hypothetical protein [Mucilaginibacter sp.]|uniref:hypothetical protein n=1 Tax=Mucilaginibacter sp. TaxID=1882438 RepID=UPI003D0AEEA7